MNFLASHAATSFVVLGAVVLAVTGAEALYADMGHFGKGPVRIGWFSVVAPALMLNYFGQGALLIVRPDTVQNPFFLLIPGWALYPMVVLATAASVIASQAVISGAYSITKQAIQLGFLPRITIVQTSARERGQVYIPGINWLLLAAVLSAVIGFGSSTSLAGAYGIAVTATMTVDTLLTFFVIRYALELSAAAVHGRDGVLPHLRLHLPVARRCSRWPTAAGSRWSSAARCSPSCAPGAPAARSSSTGCARPRCR